MGNRDFQAEANARLRAVQAAQMNYWQTGSEESGLEWIFQTMELGYFLHKQNDLPAAEDMYLRAYRAEAEMMERFHSAGVAKKLLDTCTALGLVCILQRRPEEAETYLRRGLSYWELVREGQLQIRDFRNYYSILSGLGQLANEAGDHGEAEKYYEAGMRVCRDMAQEYHFIKDRVQTALFYSWLGGLSWQTGKQLKAKLYYEQSIELQEQLLRENWQEAGVDLPMELASALGDLALIHQTGNDWGPAGDCYQRCVPLYRQRLAETQSEETAIRLSAALEGCGIALQVAGKPEMSLEYLEQCVDLRTQLFRLNRTEERYDLLGLAYYNLAMGSTGEARMRLAQQACAVWNELCRIHPDSELYKRRLATVVRDLMI